MSTLTRTYFYSYYYFIGFFSIGIFWYFFSVMYRVVRRIYMLKKNYVNQPPLCLYWAKDYFEINFEITHNN